MMRKQVNVQQPPRVAPPMGKQVNVQQPPRVAPPMGKQVNVQPTRMKSGGAVAKKAASDKAGRAMKATSSDAKGRAMAMKKGGSAKKGK